MMKFKQAEAKFKEVIEKLEKHEDVSHECKEGFKVYEEAVAKNGLKGGENDYELGKSYLSIYCLKRQMNPGNEKIGKEFLEAAKPYEEKLKNQGLSLPDNSNFQQQPDFRDLFLKTRAGNN